MSSDSKAATSYEEGLTGASEKVAEFQEKKTALGRLQHWLHVTPSAVPMIVLVAAIIIFGWASPNFFKAVTLSTILQQIAIVGILGCAQSLVVLTAGIDLSLYLLAQDHGPEVALSVAKRLVVFTQRAGGQSQFSRQQQHR